MYGANRLGSGMAYGLIRMVQRLRHHGEQLDASSASGGGAYVRRD
jgi:hypothetical protein